MRRSLILIATSFLFCTAFGGAADAGSCIDAQQTLTDDGTNRWILTNTCSQIVEVKILNQKGKICDAYRMEPRVSRAFIQRQACSSTNQLLSGCICESHLKLRERLSQ